MLRIATDIIGLKQVASAEVVVEEFSSRWKLLGAAFRSNHLVLHFYLHNVVFFVVLLTLWPFHRCRITTLDLFAGPPKRNPATRSLIRWSLARVARFLVYFKDSARLEREFSIPAHKFRYIPYKINSIELIRQASPTDGGYIFCGGRSRRDFATLFAAIASLGYPLKIVTSPESGLALHGSTLAGLPVPPNAEVLTHDSSAEFFIRTMAAARLVVLPLLPAAATQAGIAVYLQGMALGKCVIVSSGLGVSDVLPPEVACVVKAGDIEALKIAIDTNWRDEPRRQRYGQAAAQYALALGGEQDLRFRIVQALP